MRLKCIAAALRDVHEEQIEGCAVRLVSNGGGRDAKVVSSAQVSFKAWFSPVTPA